jgi:hypothetical protein
LFTFSEQFDNAAWSKFATTVTANATTAPDGTTTADQILETTANSTHLVAANAMVSVVTGQSYTISVYVKPSGRNWFRINSNFSGGSFASFDIANGVLGTVSGGTASITNAGNGWWRCSLTVVATSTGTASPDFRLATSNTTISYTGNASLGMFLWGAQMEAVTYQTTPSTYYPTTVKNLLGYSQDFSNAAWSKTNASITNCPYVNPVNGLFTAQKLMEDTAASVHQVSQIYSGGLVGGIYTFSAYLAKAERTKAFFSVTDNATGDGRVIVDLDAGTIGTPTVSGNWSDVSATIQAVSGNFYRVSLTLKKAAGGNSNVVPIIGLYTTTNNYTGDGNSGIYIYGAQLSDSASLDPYVPTPAAAPSSTAYYGPRFDYDPVTLAPKGLLVEEARTNVILTSTFATLAGSAGSQYPSGTGWSSLFNTGGTRTYVASSIFAGGQAVDISGVSAARNLIGFSFAPTASTTYTVSFYVEAASDVTGIVAYATGSLGTGGTTNNVSAPIVTGRYSYTFTTGTSPGTVDLRFGIGASANASGSIRISNVQCEAGAFATSYIPTVASTVTRSADVATITGSLFSGWYNQAQGTFLINVDSATTGYRTNLQVDDGTLNNRILIQTNNVATAQQYYVVVGGSAVVNTSAQPFAPSGSKTAAAYNLNDYAYSVNSTAVTTDTSATVPPVTRLFLGTEVSSNYLNGHIRSIQYIPNATSATQLQSLTTG